RVGGARASKRDVSRPRGIRSELCRRGTCVRARSYHRRPRVPGHRGPTGGSAARHRARGSGARAAPRSGCDSRSSVVSETDRELPQSIRQAAAEADIDPFRAQHLSLARRLIATPAGHVDVTVDEAETPLAWLVRRKGRDGQPLIQSVQFEAGERLRGDFTRAQMTPRVTSSWD